MHTANFGARRRCLLAALVEVTLTLDFFSSNAMRLIPVQLRLSNRSTADPDSRHTLELAPSPSAVHFLKPRQLPNAPADRDRLDLCDVVDDLKCILVHYRSTSGAAEDGAYTGHRPSWRNRRSRHPP